MKTPLVATLFTRSLHPAKSDLNDLLRASIGDQIADLIEQHPDCPGPVSAEVDALLLTSERLGGD